MNAYAIEVLAEDISPGMKIKVVFRRVWVFNRNFAQIWINRKYWRP